MKRDLTEFTQVVQHDTACTIAATASVVKEKLAVSGHQKQKWRERQGQECMSLGRAGRFSFVFAISLSPQLFSLFSLLIWCIKPIAMLGFVGYCPLWFLCLRLVFIVNFFVFVKTESSSGATEKVRKGLSNFLGVISDTFAPSPDMTIDCDVITLMATPSGTTELYDSAKVPLASTPKRWPLSPPLMSCAHMLLPVCPLPGSAVQPSV